MLQYRDETMPRRLTALAVATSLCAHVLSLAVPLALLQAYDRILPNQSYATTFLLAVGVAISIVLEAMLRYGRAVLFAQVGAVFESRMTLRLMSQALRAKGKALHRLGPAALADALRAVGQVRDFWSGSAAAALHELPFVVVYIALIAYIGRWLALIPLLLTLAALLAALMVMRVIKRAVHDVDELESQRHELVWGIFNGLVEAKAMAAEPVLTRRYRNAVARSMRTSTFVENGLALIRENGQLMAQVSTIAVAAFGALMVIDTQLTIGGLSACILLAGRSIGPAMAAFSYFSQLSQRREAANRIEGVLSLPEAPLWQGLGRQPFHGGTLQISGNAVDGQAVTILQGNVVRVEAPDALTATATLEAIAQLDDELALDVTFDGLSAREYDSESLRLGIAMASARTELIHGSLLDNLTLFSPQFDADAIELAYTLGLETFIDGLRQGFMTPVGPVGAEIVSPGTAVRIGLVRALVRRPAILCLDEVGGALDLDGMRRLSHALRALKGRTTLFLVSGNPELLQLADRELRILRRPRA